MGPHPAARDSPLFLFLSYENEEFIHVKCNIHAWRNAYFVVLKTSHVAVIRPGRMALSGFRTFPPAGTPSRHGNEVYGTQRQEVTLGGETQNVNFAFRATP